jgi:EmrB/QacA subfamily drug resistance transporter
MPARPAAHAPVHANLVLAICCTSVVLMAMDGTIVNVALPSIRHDFASQTSGLQWVIDAYTLVIASLLMLSGSLADRFGRRRTFQLGLSLFTLGSGLCSVAPGLNALVGFRVLQAIGGSMMNPIAMSIITNTFVEPKARARAIGTWGAIAGLAMALGPLVGGALTESIGWRAIFWVNVPIGIAAIVLTQRFVPESKAPRARRLDPLAQVLVLTVLVSVTYAVIEGRDRGFGSPLIVGLFSAGGVALVGLVAHERRRDEPLIDLRFFRSASFASATVIAVCAFSAFSGFLFLNPLYLQEIRHRSAFETGLYTLPIALAMMVCSPISGRLVGAYGARPSLVAAGIAIATSALILTGLDADTSTMTLVASYLLLGIGTGLVNAPITNAAVSGMPRAQAGVASAIASTSRQTGSALGVAIAGTIASTAGRGAHRAIDPEFTAATHGYWWLVVGLGILVTGLGIVSTGAWASATARRIARLLDEPL